MKNTPFLIRHSMTLLLCLIFFRPLITVLAVEIKHTDVAIYGGTPGGIAAAVALARRQPSTSILLITPYSRIGGMIVNGLTHPDFRTFEGRTGLFREFNRRVLAHYERHFGPDSSQVKDSLEGTHAGPEVNYRILRSMVDELPNIKRLTQHRLVDAIVNHNRLTSIRLIRGDSKINITADYFIDASYEGDLMAAAKVRYRIGREGKAEFGESLAPAVPDSQLQGYNFRLTMTDDPENRVPVSRPKGYQSSQYQDLIPLLKHGRIQRIFGDPYMKLQGGIYKRQTPKLPNQKRDINDVSHSLVRLSLPGLNLGWPDGDFEERQFIFNKHVQHNIGMLYFLQNDASVPNKFREETNQWGLCRDELVFNNHLPEQLYIREARRMEGVYVFTQSDTERKTNTNHARSRFQSESIAMGDYGPNCHGTAHEGPLIGGKHTGEFYQRAAPYQIPYGVILPKKISNLAVPVVCSSSHVGFCALRLEPIWMSLGQAAGEAIGIAMEDQSSLQEISSSKIRARLHSTGTATIYTSDVPEESPSFPAVQWFGSIGGFIDLDKGMDTYGQRGTHRIGQYYHAFPGHQVDLDKELDQDLKDAWSKRFQWNTNQREALKSANTRGEFISRAYLLK